mgnify:CR=1 FL=1
MFGVGSEDWAQGFVQGKAESVLLTTEGVCEIDSGFVII